MYLLMPQKYNDHKDYTVYLTHDTGIHNILLFRGDNDY